MSQKEKLLSYIIQQKEHLLKYAVEVRRSNISLSPVQNNFHILEISKNLKMETVVCKRFQKGFCKFEENCRKHHNKETCPNIQCKINACIKRHPRNNKYFKAHNTLERTVPSKQQITKEKSDMN